MMKTFTIAATFLLVAATSASAQCAHGYDATAKVSTPVKQKLMSERVEVAKAPVDAWLIKYLDEWEKA